jgi:hypothetical protein
MKQDSKTEQNIQGIKEYRQMGEFEAILQKCIGKSSSKMKNIIQVMTHRLFLMIKKKSMTEVHILGISL